MKIYKSNGALLLDVLLNDDSYRHREIMGDNNLTLYFSLPEHTEIPVGAYCDFENERYTLERPEALTMHHTRNFEYVVTMESVQAKAKIWKFRNPVDGRLKFSLTAKPIEHLQMFVDNMNRRDSGWTVEECIDEPETLVSYDHAYCWDALGQMADTFNTEFQIVGKRVSLRKVEYNKSNPLPLSYGRGNGFKSGVGRQNYGDTPPIEILYPQGGDSNIDPSKYGSSELHLPKGGTIAYDGEYFEDDSEFNADNARQYIVDEQGMSVRRLDKDLSSLAEDSLDCSSIYPKRIGTITEVIVVSADSHEYDFIDNTIPDTLNYEDCLIEGEKMTVIFQDKQLAGREFEVKYIHEAKNGKKGNRFEVVPQEIDGQTMPSEEFPIEVTGTYAVFNCMLPQAYINAHTSETDPKTGAEWDMMRQAVKYLYDHEEQTFTFSGTLDGIWAKKDWINIGGRIILGGYVLFTDDRFQKEGVRVRIIGIKDYVNNPHSPEIELSNNTVTGSFKTQLATIESQEVLVDEYHRDALQFTKRRFRDAQETMAMLEDALLDNFENSIKPLTVQTMMMLVGDESLQFQFVGSPTSGTVINPDISYDQTAKQMHCPEGYIQHLTLGITSVSSQHSLNEYKFWHIAEFTSAILDDSQAKYYLYAVCDETAGGTQDIGQAIYLLSETARPLSQDGKYNLLIGVLNSEFDGERSFVTLYGFTEVLPGRITTDRIVSGNGLSYFDLVANAMKLGDRLQFNVNGDGQLKIKGTIVQNQSGDESYIGCYRGVYNSEYTYYNGDEVSYTDNGMTSTYRYINDTASKGHAPTETDYWQVIAAGSKGDKGENGNSGNNGDWVSFVFKQSDTKPETPTSTTPIPDGWQDTPSAEGKWWMSKATISGTTDKAGKWSEPVQTTAEDGVDGAYTDFKYAKNTSSTSFPAIVTSDRNPSGWSDEPPTLSTGEFLWMSQAEINADGTLKTNWSTPVRISGEKGDSGNNGIVYYFIYTLASATPTTPSFTTLDALQKQSVWTIQPPTPTNTQFLYMSQSPYNPNTATFGTWTTPIRISGKDGATGADGTDIEFIYLRNTGDTPSTPTSVNVDKFVPSGWSDSPQGITETYKYEWICVRTKPKGESSWSDFSTPVIWSRWGDKGTDGDGTEYIFTLTEAETAPSTPTATSSASGYVPTGWTGEPSGVSADYPFEWVSVRHKTDGAWGAFSSPSLWSNYAVWNPNLLEQTEFTGMDRLDRWDIVSRYYGGSGTDTSIAHINTDGVDGHNCFYDANAKRADESEYKEVLRQVLLSSTVEKLKPSTWYTLSFYSKCGTTIQSVGETSNAYGFAKRDLYLKTGKTYKLSINGNIDSQAKTDGKELRVYVYQDGWGWSKTVSINATTATTATLSFSDVPTDGVYRFAAYLYDSSDPRTGTATLNWVSVLEVGGTIFQSFVFPTVADTSKVIVDGVTRYNYIGANGGINYQENADWQKHTMSFKTKDSLSVTKHVLFRLQPCIMSGNTPYLYICMPKLELGKVATAYDANSEDNRPDYWEYRFAKNGSTSSSPSLVNTDAEPSGWSTVQPSVGTLEYLWMTVAKKSGTGALLENWSTPVRVTPYDGKDGEDGKSPAMVYRGVYDSSKTYYGNQYRVDAVQYNGAYYVTRIDAGTFLNVLPTNTAKWNSFGASFESIATGLLLAENANIAGWIFRNNRLEAQSGSVYLDGNTGKVRLNGTLQLSTGWTGNFSDVNVFYLPEISSGSSRTITLGYEEEDIGKVCRLYNSGRFGYGDYGIQMNTFTVEDGSSYSESSMVALVRPQEVVEFTCFEMPYSGSGSGRTAQWTVSARFSQDDFIQSNAKGRFPKVIAMGYVRFGSSTAALSGTYYDGSTITAKITATYVDVGMCKISFAESDIPDGYRVFASARSYVSGNVVQSAYACVAAISSTSFYLKVDATYPILCGIDFMIYSPHWDYPMTYGSRG